MPELPDVEVFRRYFDSASLHKPISDVKIEYLRLVKNSSSDEISKKLKNREFVYTRRHGKYLFAQLASNGWLTFHFGMSAFLEYLQDGDEQPNHTGLLIDFSDGSHLAYVTQRKLGSIELVNDPNDFIEENELGYDALDETLDFEIFREIFSNTKMAVKPALMKQETICGIGNVYSDEILFQSYLHPKKPMNELTEKEWGKLYSSTREVLQTAIESQADPEKMPNDYLLPQRHKGDKCPRCKGTIQAKKVGGRTAYYCPQCQKL